MVTDTLTNTSYMCGGQAIAMHGRAQRGHVVHPYQQLAVAEDIAEVHDRSDNRQELALVNLLLFPSAETVHPRKDVVRHLCHAPEMASLSNALHLLLLGLSATPRFLHVPGKANPADIPSRVPFVRQAGSHALDPDRLSPADARVVAALCACYLPMILPTAA
jgi:hypothetical protein